MNEHIDVLRGLTPRTAHLPTQARGLSALFRKETVSMPGQGPNGTPKIVTKEYCDLYIAGDRKSTVTKELKPAIREAWLAEKGLTQEYANWKASTDPMSGIGAIGMPVSEWPSIAREQAEHLRMHKVFTVEQLSELPDSALANLGPGYRDLQDLAKRWLQQSKETGSKAVMARELDNMSEDLAKTRKDNEDLRAQVKLLNDQMAAVLQNGAAAAGNVSAAAPPPPAPNRTAVDPDDIDIQMPDGFGENAVDDE